ncbi:MAG: acyl carrier protein [Bdellovibrionota bacterium]
MPHDTSQKNLHESVRLALSQVTGNDNIECQSFLKKDLGITSIDIIDLFFEIERSLGKKLNVRHLFLTSSLGELGKNDMRVKEFIEYLERSMKAQ